MINADFDLTLLRTFVAVVDAGSLTRASETIHRSQAAVSMQVQRLESAVGTPLFIRNGRRLVLTRAGCTLLEYARRLLDLRTEAWQAVVRPDIEGNVILGVPEDYVSALLQPVLRRFSAMYPSISVEIVCAASTVLAPLLADSSIDVAFVTQDKQLRGELVRREPMRWVGLAADAHLLNAQPLPVALYEQGCVARHRVLNALDKAGIEYREVCNSASVLGLIAMVETGLAITALPACSVPAHFRELTSSVGLPELGPLDIVVARSAKSHRLACDYLAEQMVQDLGDTAL